MFKPVDSRASFPEMEQRILRFWKERDIFRRSIEERPEENTYVFYEGPPTANARPGVHHVLARVFKDLFPRYQTMRGRRVPRKAGWDTHGLPVELEVERALGLKSKVEIEEFGIEEFNRRCRESVFRYVKEWEALTERIGFWLDMEHPYITYDNEYIESVWWIVKQLWERELLYQDYRVTPHCPRCGTSLSDGEVALGYQENTPDPSVYIKFRLAEGTRRSLAEKVPENLPLSLVAWTTTPWTLPGNTALAVQRNAEYSVAEVDGEGLILASSLLGVVLGEGNKVVATLTGEELVGFEYEPLYEPEEWDGVQAMAFKWDVQGIALAPLKDIDLGSLAPDDDRGAIEVADLLRLASLPPDDSNKPSRLVIAAEFVSLNDGTGIVHIAPAFGAEDFELGRAEKLLFVQPVDLKGEVTGGPFAGLFVKDADKPVLADLEERGLLLRQETIRHTYPFCWRCSTPLLYYAKPAWYIRTTKVKESLNEGNERINWYPQHIKHGRFGDWLRNNVDWALSRERYWGTPLPVWRCEGCGELCCIGSRADIRERAMDPAAVDALTDLHRPYVDLVKLRCQSCDGTMSRLPEVMDCWFDSGAMPYAQWHYPFENADIFDRSFPADFICEAVDQTRGWFYTLHAEAVLLNAAEAAPENLSYRNVLSLGHILDDRGRKMSKSQGNVVEPMEVIEAHGADALRWYLYTATRPGEPRRFSARLVAESLRRFLLTLWNTYSFFVTYANIDRFEPVTDSPGDRSELDRWLLSELNVLVERVTEGLDAYEPTTAGRAIQAFVEDLSNWYVRRSRRRFWKGGSDADKQAAYRTLYVCLVTLSKLLAPFTPFMAEEMYQNLVRSVDEDAPESVHLVEWPRAEPLLADQLLNDETRLVMRVVSLGRAARSRAGIKVRQPLSRVVIKTRNAAEESGLKRLEAQILEELNVKSLFVVNDESEMERLAVASDDAGYSVGLDTDISLELRDEGRARELVHRIQSMRKTAGFEISDRIVTYFQGGDWLGQVLEKYAGYIVSETLTNSLHLGDVPPPEAHGEELKIDGEVVALAVRRID